MRLRRTIHAKLLLDRKGKREAVKHEYWAWQRELNGGDEELYSATKKNRKQNGHGVGPKEYPLILRRDCVKIRHQKDSAFKWWIRIPLENLRAFRRESANFINLTL